jgi:hypothetical protein
MLEDALDNSSALPKPHTATVVVLLLITAITLSYLGAYALVNALVAAEMLSRWPSDADPRLRWFLEGIAALFMLFVATGGAARFLSRRQLRRIDAMAE